MSDNGTFDDAILVALRPYLRDMEATIEHNGMRLSLYDSTFHLFDEEWVWDDVWFMFQIDDIVES